VERTALTSALAAYLAEASFERLSPHVVGVARLLLLDCLGVAVAGADEPAARIVAALIREEGGNPNCTVFGTDLRSSASAAALANGTAAHALDFDDTHHPGFLHPSAVLVPAICALAEEKSLDGRSVLTAFMYGLDVMTALGAVLNPSHYERGWHATSTIGSVMAATACGLLLGLSPVQMMSAIGIGATEASGIRRNFGTMSKPFHAGMAARNGIVAAKLAAAGFTADSAILEGERGFGDVFQGAAGWDRSRFFTTLNHRFDLAIEGLAVKQFAACGATHPPIEAILNLRREHHLIPEQVEEIRVVTHPMLKGILIHQRPETGLEGKFSVQHCLAVALVDGFAGLSQFTDERVQDPIVKDLARRVIHVTDPTVGLAGHMSWGAVVTVRLKDGRELANSVEVARGKWIGQPLTSEEIEAKFIDCARIGGLSPDSIGFCIDFTSSLQSQASIGALMAAFRRVGSPSPRRPAQ
jgi:2-methylcitrate dehydratase PrpD